MTADQLPLCPFCQTASEASGDRSYQSKNYSYSGGNFARSFSQQDWKCGDCGATVVQIGGHGNQILTFIPNDLMSLPDQHGGQDYPKEWLDWVDGVFLVAGRTRDEKLEAHRVLEWRKWVDEVARVKWPEFRWDENYNAADGGYHSWPRIMQAEHDHIFGHFYPSLAGNMIPLPIELARPLYPPRIPNSGMKFFRHTRVGWEPVDYDYSWIFGIEEDPIIRRNREFFESVFSEAFTSRDYKVVEIPNQYENQPLGTPGVQPWYWVTTGWATLEIGWRKRVVHIRATYDHEVDVSHIRSLAQRDKVTFETLGPEQLYTTEQLEAEIRSGSNQFSEGTVQFMLDAHRERFPEGEPRRERSHRNSTMAEVVIIHAWSKEPCVEYLRALVEKAL